MEQRVKNAKPHEEKIFFKYVKERGIVYVVFLIGGLIATGSVLCGPIVLPQSLPTDAKYPFSVDKTSIWAIIYIQQAVVGLQCTLAGGIDIQMAMLIWFVIARLEILGDEMSNVKNSHELHACIRTHQYLLR